MASKRPASRLQRVCDLLPRIFIDPGCWNVLDFDVRIDIHDRMKALQTTVSLVKTFVRPPTIRTGHAVRSVGDELGRRTGNLVQSVRCCDQRML